MRGASSSTLGGLGSPVVKPVNVSARKQFYSTQEVNKDSIGHTHIRTPVPPGLATVTDSRARSPVPPWQVGFQTKSRPIKSVSPRPITAPTCLTVAS